MKGGFQRSALSHQLKPIPYQPIPYPLRIHLILFKDLVLKDNQLFAVHLAVKTTSIAGVTGGNLLVDFHHQRVLVAIHQHLFDLLNMP